MGDTISILHIEDEPAIQTGFARACRKRFPGCELIQVSTSTAAIALLSQRSFSVVVSDRDLDAGTVGEQVLEHIRSAGSAQPFMFFSGNESVISTLGVPFVTKPASVLEVCAMITNIIK